MRGLRVLLVLLVGCGGAVAVTESGGDGGPTSPDASLDDGGVIIDATAPETSSIAEASVDGVADTGPVDAGVDAIVDASALDGEAGDADTDAGPPPETVVDVATSRSKTCFVMSTGRLFCAGSGFGTTPTLVAGVTDAVEVAIGGREGLAAHTCIRRKGGTVDCWGYNSHGQVGDGTANNVRATPAPVTGLNDVVQIALPDDDMFTCARKSDGTVWCWGVSNYAQLGIGWGGYAKVPFQVRGLTDAVDLAVGFGGGCAIRNGGQVVCWGLAEGGRLGDGFLPHDDCPYLALPNRCSFYPVPANISDAVAIARGGTSGYVIRADGTVWGWGWGVAGLGTGSTATGIVPIATLGPVVATKISAGAHGACAVRPNGTVTCWGIDPSGQLGNGSPATDSTSPVDVLGIADATNITHRSASVCALRGGSKVSCWGRNEYGNLANGATANITPSPVDVVW